MSDPYIYASLREQGVEKELAFPAAEFEERIARAVELAGERGLDALLLTTTPSVGYLTGADTCMPPTYLAALITAAGDLVVQCAEVEVPTILRHSIVEDLLVFPWTDVGSAAAALADLLRSRGLASGRVGMELTNPDNFGSGACDAGTYLELRELLPSLEPVDVAGEVLELRLIKSAAEVEHMKTAGRISNAAALEALAVAAEGASENLVVAEAYAASTRAGSEAMSIDPMLMSGPRTGLMPHLPYRRNPLAAGDMVYLEMTGTIWRYNAPIMRSAVIGEPSAQARQLSDASLEVLGILLDEVVPGRTCDEVSKLAAKVWDGVPGVYFHGAYGYSIGMGFQPTWTENAVYIALGSDRVLEPGMAFHLPINPFVPGGEGVGFSESIVVTETGCELLTRGEGRELLVR